MDYHRPTRFAPKGMSILHRPVKKRRKEENNNKIKKRGGGWIWWARRERINERARVCRMKKKKARWMFRCGLISYRWAIALVKRRGRTEREKGGKGRREGRKKKNGDGRIFKRSFFTKELTDIDAWWTLIGADLFDGRKKTQQPSSTPPAAISSGGFRSVFVEPSSRSLALPCLFIFFYILILTTGNEREILLKGIMSMSVSSPPVHVYTRSIL